MTSRRARYVFPGWRPAAILLLLLSLGCGGGSGGGGGGAAPQDEPPTTEPVPSAEGQQSFLSGVVVGEDRLPLEGVEVSIGDRTTAVTDALGRFVMLRPDSGFVRVGIRERVASPAQGPQALNGSSGHDLQVPQFVNAVGSTSLPSFVTLPDFSAAETGQAQISGGRTVGPTIVGTGTLVLTIPADTQILIDGLPPPDGALDVSILTAEPLSCPYAPPAGEQPCPFFLIRPEKATFDQPLAISLPNRLDLIYHPEGGLLDPALGTRVDLWTFDETMKALPETGTQLDDVLEGWRRDTTLATQAVVDPTATMIVGSLPGTGIVPARGGWHAATVPIEQSYATTLSGRVVYLDEGGTPQPLPYATVGVVESGQRVTADVAGLFTLEDVPDYVAAPANHPKPTQRSDEPMLVNLEIQARVAYGGGQAGVPVAANSTSLGDVSVGTLPPLGIFIAHVKSFFLGLPDTATIYVDDAGEPGAEVAGVTYDEATGQVAAIGLDPGDYLLKLVIQAPGGDREIWRSFTVYPYVVTTGVIAPVGGTGSDSVTVHVVADLDANPDTDPVAVGGAVVTLYGADTDTTDEYGSVHGLVQLTDEDGLAVFQKVSPPYAVSAQYDRQLSTPLGRVRPLRTRHATSVLNVTPGTDGVLHVPILSSIGLYSLQLTGLLNGSVDVGVVPDTYVEATDRIDILATGVDTAGEAFTSAGVVNPLTMRYSIPVRTDIRFDVVAVHTRTAPDLASGAIVERTLGFKIFPFLQVTRSVPPFGTEAPELGPTVDLTNLTPVDGASTKYEVSLSGLPDRTDPLIPVRKGAIYYQGILYSGGQFQLLLYDEPDGLTEPTNQPLIPIPTFTELLGTSVVQHGRLTAEYRHRGGVWDTAHGAGGGQAVTVPLDLVDLGAPTGPYATFSFDPTPDALQYRLDAGDPFQAADGSCPTWITAEQARGHLEFQLTPSAAQPVHTWNQILLFGMGDGMPFGGSFDIVEWRTLAPPGQTEIVLPDLADDMFGHTDPEAEREFYTGVQVYAWPDRYAWRDPLAAPTFDAFFGTNFLSYAPGLWSSAFSSHNHPSRDFMIWVGAVPEAVVDFTKPEIPFDIGVVTPDLDFEIPLDRIPHADDPPDPCGP